MKFFNLKYFSFSFSHNIVKYCSSKIITWSKWPTFTIGFAWFSFRWGLLYIHIMCLIFKRRTTQGKMKRNQIKGPFGLKGKGGRVEGSRVELAESRLISDHIYSTPLPSPLIQTDQKSVFNSINFNYSETFGKIQKRSKWKSWSSWLSLSTGQQYE